MRSPVVANSDQGGSSMACGSRMWAKFERALLCRMHRPLPRPKRVLSWNLLSAYLHSIAARYDRLNNFHVKF